MDNTYGRPAYPLFIRLENQPVVVIGAGEVATRKILTLLEYGALVTVVAPQATDTVRGLVAEKRITLIERPYETGDIRGALLAVVSTSNREVNEAAYREAREAHILVNVVDVPELCTCMVPSVLRRGQLQIAVSTNGAAPSLAREIRKDLEEDFPAWWEEYVDLLGDVRALVKARVPGEASRRTPLFEALTHADLETRLALGEKITPEQVYDEVIAPLVGDDPQKFAAGGDAR